MTDRGDESAEPAPDGRRVEPDGRRNEPDDDPDMGDLFDELSELEALVDTPEEREQVRETMRTAMEVNQPSIFGRVISGFDASDASEALLGALVFGIPMFVEGGTQEVGEFIATRPAYFVATNGLAVALVVGILYVADIQDVRVRNPIFGILPRKLTGVLSVAALTALGMMTAWGRVDWGEPWLALCQVSVAFVPIALGAALGDLLPG
jgi:uncharacterized membrane protein